MGYNQNIKNYILEAKLIYNLKCNLSIRNDMGGNVISSAAIQDIWLK